MDVLLFLCCLWWSRDLWKLFFFPAESFVDLCREKEMWPRCGAGLAALPSLVSPGLSVLLVPLSCCGAYCFICSCSKEGQKSILQPFPSLKNPLLVKSCLILSAVVDQSSVSSSRYTYLYPFSSSSFSPAEKGMRVKTPHRLWGRWKLLKLLV